LHHKLTLTKPKGDQNVPRAFSSSDYRDIAFNTQVLAELWIARDVIPFRKRAAGIWAVGEAMLFNLAVHLVT
jgi:hypothetical protein